MGVRGDGVLGLIRCCVRAQRVQFASTHCGADGGAIGVP
eukprot:SAG25_NODE_571_length_6846_cov_4.575070_3_plen_39_part_00